MATYSDQNFDGFPSIHRYRGREGWKADDLTRDSLNMQHRSLTDLQDQVRYQKEELRRKNDLIRDLQSLETLGPEQPIHRVHYQQHHQLPEVAVNACPTARSDLVAMQARLDGVSARLRDREAELDTAGETIRGLRSELARQQDSQEARTAEERRRRDFAARVRDHLGVACPPEDLDGLAAKVAELVKENVDMKAKIHGLTDKQAAMDLEARNNKLTIERLLAEVNRELRATLQLEAGEAGFKTEMEKIKEENEALKKKDELLEIQLAAEKGSVAAGKTALQDKEAQCAKLECDKREAAHSAETLGKQLAGFVDSLATLLSTAYSRVPANEEAVREKVRQLLADVRSHSVAMATLEERVKSVAGQLEQQLEANRQREQRGQQADSEAKELRDKLRAVEAELAAGDVIRESLRADKDRLYKYLQRLGHALSLENSAIDVAYDVLGEGLVERAEQLTRQGGGCCGCENGGGLRRRVQSLKEQLESKELHLELMRRRLAQVDPGGVLSSTPPPPGGGGGGGVSSGVALDLERERARKAERRLEKARRLLEEARLEADELRTQLGSFGELKAAATRQDQDLEHLESALDKLERVRQKQAQRIAALKAQLGECRRDADESLRCLAEELRAARRELDDAARRERQLTELRSAVSRLVLANAGGGIGAAESGTVSDADIVTRLDRLLWQRREMEAMQQRPPLLLNHHHSNGQLCCECQPQQLQQQQQHQLPCGDGGGCECRGRDHRHRSSRRHSASGGGGGVRSASCGAECRRY